MWVIFQRKKKKCASKPRVSFLPLENVQVPAPKQEDLCWPCWKKPLVKLSTRAICSLLTSFLKMARPLLLKLSSFWGLHPIPPPRNTKPKHLISLQTFSRYTEVICKEQQGNNIHASCKAATGPGFCAIHYPFPRTFLPLDFYISPFILVMNISILVGGFKVVYLIYII